MTSVRAALAGSCVAALALALAFGPGALELVQASQRAQAVQQAADLAGAQQRQDEADAAAALSRRADRASTSASTASGPRPSATPTVAPTAARRAAASTIPTMAVPAGVPLAPRPPTHEDGRPIVYLSFDDGPDPTWTPQVLALLARYHATATFFLVGEEVARFPAVAAQVRSAGHAVGNHTYTHPWLTKLTTAAVTSELTRTDARIGATRCVRPPGGFVDAMVGGVASRLHKSVQLWDTDTKDWSRPGVAPIVATTLRELRPGIIVLMHDGGGDRSQSVQALGQILPALQAKGYVVRPLPACR